MLKFESTPIEKKVRMKKITRNVFASLTAPGTLDALFDATFGQPFLTQALAFELVQLLNEEQRREATLADLDVAIQRTLTSSSEYFANIWLEAGAGGREVLLALARGEPLPDHATARAWLRAHEVLNDAGAYAVPMMAWWVKKEKLARVGSPR